MGDGVRVGNDALPGARSIFTIAADCLRGLGRRGDRGSHHESLSTGWASAITESNVAIAEARLAAVPILLIYQMTPGHKERRSRR